MRYDPPALQLAALPVPELLEQRVARGRVEVVLAQRSGEPDRLAELLDVGGAAVAVAEVRLEARTLGPRERPSR